MDVYSANLMLFLTALGFSVIASYFDAKTGEIPDKFTIGLVVVALLLRGVFSMFFGFDYLLDGIIVGGIFFAFGAFLFYTGGWGGGDAKLIAGIGAALGGFIMPSIVAASLFFPAIVGFFVALSIVAIPYSLAYALVLSFKSPNVFKLTKKRIEESWFVFVIAIIASISMMILINPINLAIALALLSPPIFFLLMAFTKSVEAVAMQKDVLIKDLREGDMVVEDLVVKGKKLASKRDMDGLSDEALKKILSTKGLPEKVRIKWGVRFAPAFPLALIICPFWSEILLLFF